MFEPNFASNPSGTNLDPGRDLSAEIVAMVEREPGDLVKVTRVGEMNYRCNWWSARFASDLTPPRWTGESYGTHVVRKSQFLQVVATPDGLVLRDVGVAGAVG